MPVVTLDEAKNYLRVDGDEDDRLIESLLDAAERICMDIARLKKPEKLAKFPSAKPAVLYAAAYLYEHREEADHRALALTLRAMLFGLRKAAF